MRPILNEKQVKPSNPKSLLWKHFGDDLNGSTAHCQICKGANRDVHIKMTQGGTGGRKSHLKTHKTEYQQFQADYEKEKKDEADTPTNVRKRAFNNNEFEATGPLMEIE